MNSPKPLRKALIASVAALLGLAIVAVCFVGYLTPAALFSLLTGSAFCG
ncbi:hypothetical protein P3T24_003303 [Paraburkholderia sp. GAS33]|jgi:hypothetical protein|uniref:Uncharacterized protein n=1 Tax=Paraburkholderia phenazinium TaxID=60549 RepID=A0A1N6HIP5_9BURK|nr:hypothetical protein SAMN05444168_3328 [Paraburkholderia phenazinium]